MSGKDGWGKAFDLQRTDAPAWLGQFAGVVLPRGRLSSSAPLLPPVGRVAAPVARLSRLPDPPYRSKLVTLTEKAGGDPYKLIVQVFQPQMPGRGSHRAAITAALPAGLRAKWELAILTGQSWQQLRVRRDVEHPQDADLRSGEEPHP